MQKYGVDYDEVFAPVVGQSTFRTLLAIACHKGMTVKYLEAETAFLNGELEETILEEALPGGCIHANKNGNDCKLKKRENLAR